MRVYKLNDQYIDLDHVLMVSDLEWWSVDCGNDADAWFYVTLAFRQGKEVFSFGTTDDYDKRLEHLDKIKSDYESFLKAWQAK